MNNFLKDILIFCMVFMPPLLLFIKFWNYDGKSKMVLVIISLFYVSMTFFTQNLIPFIFVILNIWYLKKYSNDSIEYENSHYQYDYSMDYERFNFNIRNIKIGTVLKCVLYSYLFVIIASVISNFIFSAYHLNPKEQDIITWMVKLPVYKFLFMVPVAALFAPVLEEFVFRWLIFEKIFNKRLNIYISALLSSIIFATAHFNVRSFFVIITIGLYNCYLIHKHGYWYSVINHSIFNLVTTITLLFEKIGIINIPLS